MAGRPGRRRGFTRLSLVTSSPHHVGRTLGIETNTVERLVRAGGLRGELDLPRTQRWVEYDPAWSRKDLWVQFAAQGFAFDDEGDVDVVVRIKRMLVVQDEPWCEDFLAALAQVRGRRAMLASEARTLLRGPDDVRAAAVKRYAEIAEHAEATGAGCYYPPIELDELMQHAPDEMQALAGTCRDPDRGVLFEQPEANLMSRVGAMPLGQARWLATVALLVHPTHGGLSGRIPNILAMIERLSPEVEDGSFADPELMAQVLASIVAQFGEKGGPTLATINSYVGLQEMIAAYIDWQSLDPDDKDHAFVLSLLPAELPKALRKQVWKERERVTVDALKARAISAGEVARRAAQRLVCLHARLQQMDRLTQIADAEIAKIEQAWAAGKDVKFPIGISDTYRVIRPDGTVVPGLRQTVSLEIVTEEMLWLETTHGSDWERKVEQYLSAKARATSPRRADDKVIPGRYAAAKDGMYYEPGGDRRMFVRYAGTTPAASADDEHHPPYLVEVYAQSALVVSRHMSREQVRSRQAYVDEVGLERAPKAMMGLTWWTERVQHNLAHYVLRYTGRVLLPLKQIRLTLAYGSAVARLELMSGLRIGETMQARHGGCFKNATLGERLVATMTGRPKGWTRDRLWIVDGSTMKLLRQIKEWVIENWFADIGVLPIVEYGERNKNQVRLQCPPARYLFQTGGSAAKNEVLNRCLRIATLGMPHARSHDYRFAFGKLLRIRKATKRQRARALSHDEGSPMVPLYGDWDCEGLDEDDIVVALYQDDLEREQLEKMIDAA